VVSAIPIPGGAHGGTPAACHESKALYFESKGDRATAATHTKLASESRVGHYKGGGHKRDNLKQPWKESPMTAMCHEAQAVFLENHGNKAGAQAERAKINKAQFQKEYQRADKNAVANQQKEGWKGKKGGH